MKRVPLISILAFLLLWLTCVRGTAQGLEEQLIAAIEAGDPKQVQAVLKEGADVNLTVPSSSPVYLFFLSREMYLDGLQGVIRDEKVWVGAVHANAAKADEKIMKLLLKRKANFDAGDSEGKTPLMYALRTSGGEAFALRLIRKGANYTTRDHAGNTAMHYAAFGGNLEGVQLTLTGGTDINVRNGQGITPLHAAAVRAGVDVLQAMVNLGADVNALDSAGMSLMHYAAGYGGEEKLGWILGKSPNLMQPAGNGMTPLDIARIAGNTEGVAFLRKQGGVYNQYRYEELVGALEQRDFDQVRVVLADGANPNRKGKEYPLHIAARLGDNISSDHLLKAGADPGLLNEKGRTALEVALDNGHATTALILLKGGAEPSSDLLGIALSRMATQENPGHWEDVVLAMIPRVGNLEVPGGKMNLPPLHYAAYLGHEGIVRALVGKGANARTLDAEGWSALHWAVMKRDLLPRHPEKVAIAKLLVENGCPVDVASTAPKRLPHTQPYLAKRVPANATAADLLAYALPKDADMAVFLKTTGAKGNLAAPDYVENARFFYQSKEYSDAMAELNRALQANPRNADALFLRGECKRQNGLLEEAERDYSEALKQGGPNVEALLARGKIRLDLGRMAQAFQDLDLVVRDGYKKPESLYWRGKASLRMGNTSAACADYHASSGLGYEPAATAVKLYCQ